MELGRALAVSGSQAELLLSSTRPGERPVGVAGLLLCQAGATAGF